MLNKNILFALLFLIISGFTISAQQEFDIRWLEQPQNYFSELEACFEYSETESYRPEESIYVCFLKNGYAQAVFENPKNWVPDVVNRKVLEITIVFSKYPYFKEDWITNYYSLLSRRLIMLFRLDPSLNSAKIKWKLLVQTHCKTEEDAMKMLHGIEIRSEYFLLEEKETATAQTNNLKTKISPDSLPNPANPREDYWDSYYQQEVEWQQSNDDYQKQFKKKAKRAKRKEPKCPDFSKKKRFGIF